MSLLRQRQHPGRSALCHVSAPGPHRILEALGVYETKPQRHSAIKDRPGSVGRVSRRPPVDDARWTDSRTHGSWHVMSHVCLSRNFAPNRADLVDGPARVRGDTSVGPFGRERSQALIERHSGIGKRSRTRAARSNQAIVSPFEVPGRWLRRFAVPASSKCRQTPCGSDHFRQPEVSSGASRSGPRRGKDPALNGGTQNQGWTEPRVSNRPE